MNQERLLKILLAPHSTEKVTRLGDSFHQVAFKVLPDASKPEIKSAVEFLFNVQVDSVQVVNVKGKVKRFGRMLGRRQDWKKAYVTLKSGSEIDFTSNQ